MHILVAQMAHFFVCLRETRSMVLNIYITKATREKIVNTVKIWLEHLLHSFGQIHIFVRSRGSLSHRMHQSKTGSGPKTKNF